MEVKEIFEEYDRLCGSESDEALEAWLADKCAAYAAERPLDAVGQSALYNELGSFYRARGVYDKGEQAFLKAKALLEEIANIPMELEGPAVSCSCCCPEGAESYAVPGEKHTEYVLSDHTGTSDYATTLNNLAGLYRLAGQYDKALDMFADAQKIYDGLDSVPADVYASCYNNMGLVYLDLKRCENAAECFNRALAIAEKAENNGYILGTTTSNLAFSYMLSGDKAAAAAKLREAAEHFLRAGGEDDEMYKNCLDLAGRLENGK